jgi:hypothetical protein
LPFRLAIALREAQRCRHGGKAVTKSFSETSHLDGAFECYGTFDPRGEAASAAILDDLRELVG